MVKSFFTVRDTQRDSQSYMKKRRGRREIKMSRRRTRGAKRREMDLRSCLFQSVLRSPDTHRDSQNWIGKGRGRKEIEVI